MVGGVGECCNELGTPIAIPFQSDTKDLFSWNILGMLLLINWEK